MPRPFVFPDPDDRSKNAPSIIVTPQQILGIYNQENSDDKKEKVVESVQNWFIKKAEEEGWSDASFHGNQCLLINEFGEK